MHLTEEGLLQIINLRASINLAGFAWSNLHKSNFPNYKSVARLPTLVGYRLFLSVTE